LELLHGCPLRLHGRSIPATDSASCGWPSRSGRCRSPLRPRGPPRDAGCMSTDRDRERRRLDLHTLRVLAWLVQRDKYRAEPRRVEGGRRGKARIARFTYHVEIEDLREAEAAVREIVARRDSSNVRTKSGR